MAVRTARDCQHGAWVSSHAGSGPDGLTDRLLDQARGTQRLATEPPSANLQALVRAHDALRHTVTEEDLGVRSCQDHAHRQAIQGLKRAGTHKLCGEELTMDLDGSLQMGNEAAPLLDLSEARTGAYPGAPSHPSAHCCRAGCSWLRTQGTPVASPNRCRTRNSRTSSVNQRFGRDEHALGDGAGFLDEDVRCGVVIDVGS